MSKYLHECKGERFEIDVDGLRLDDARAPQCFIARIRKVSGTRPKVVVEKGRRRREVYGHTEAWALRNAQVVLDCGNWTVENEPVRRFAGHSEFALV